VFESPRFHLDLLNLLHTKCTIKEIVPSNYIWERDLTSALKPSDPFLPFASLKGDILYKNCLVQKVVYKFGDSLENLKICQLRANTLEINMSDVDKDYSPDLELSDSLSDSLKLIEMTNAHKE